MTSLIKKTEVKDNTKEKTSISFAFLRKLENYREGLKENIIPYTLIFPFFINHYSISVFSCMLVNSWPTFKILPFIFEKNYNFTILHHYKNNEYSLQKHWSLQKSVKNKLKIICNLLVTFWSISFLYFFPWIYISYYFCLVEVKIYIPFKKYPTLFI